MSDIEHSEPMETLITSIHTLYVNYSDSWAHSVLFITCASFIAWIVWRIVYRRIEMVANHTKLAWDNLLLDALQAPITALIWCWPATVSLGFILQLYTDGSLDWLGTLKQLLLIAIIVWFFTRFIKNAELHILAANKRDETTVQAVTKVLKLFVVIIGVLTGLQTLGLSLSGLLTFGGVGGLIVGLAAKDLLSNFFGGMMIYFDRPFKVGDWIRSPDRSIEGTVERIGWRMTIIRTFDKRPLYVPNSVFSNIVVENPSRMHNRRIYETIGLRYEDKEKVSAIIEDVKTMLLQHEEIDSTQTLIVNLNQFGPSSLDFFVYTFTKTVNWVRFHEIKQDVLLQIMDIIHQHGADIALPTQTLNVQPSLLSKPSLTEK